MTLLSEYNHKYKKKLFISIIILAIFVHYIKSPICHIIRFVFENYIRLIAAIIKVNAQLNYKQYNY